MDSTRKLFNLARQHMEGRDLLPLVAFDPGGGGYAAVFSAIVNNGEEALEYEYEGLPIFKTFDFSEAIGLFGWGVTRDREECWFRILTRASHLLARLLGEDEIALNYSLVMLIIDSFKLRTLGDPQAPTDILYSVFEETRARAALGDGDPFFNSNADPAFCLLAQLLVIQNNNTDEADALCRELDAIQLRSREYYLPGTWESNPAFTKIDHYVWGLTNFNQLHPDWYRLVETRFPTTSETLRATKRKLLEDGAKWAKKKPKLLTD